MSWSPWRMDRIELIFHLDVCLDFFFCTLYFIARETSGVFLRWFIISHSFYFFSFELWHVLHWEDCHCLSAKKETVVNEQHCHRHKLGPMTEVCWGGWTLKKELCIWKYVAEKAALSHTLELLIIWACWIYTFDLCCIFSTCLPPCPQPL